jgi:two-component system, LytTR family, sensor kinase
MLAGLTVAVAVALPVLVVWTALRRRRFFSTGAEEAAFAVLHQANQAAPPLRAGLSASSASRSARHLRRLLGAPALAVTDRSQLLAWDGEGEEAHAAAILPLVGRVLADGGPIVIDPGALVCGVEDCSIRAGVLVPIETAGTVVGTLAVLGPAVRAGTIRAASEVAQWVATQVELGQFDQSQARVAAAEVRALRAQISPHFIYNALTAIASFVRTDPERARELLQQFADFTRYSFRSHGQFTTLAEELRSIDAYLTLERARFGDRLQVRVQVAPEVLPVAVPFLVLQPLVENAIRHGIEGRPGPGEITIVAEDAGNECRITVEDNGIGMDPDELRRRLAGEAGREGVGLANVDERMRQVFGDEFGLVVDTGVDAGTVVHLRVPKYRVGVRAS